MHILKYILYVICILYIDTYISYNLDIFESIDTLFLKPYIMTTLQK